MWVGLFSFIFNGMFRYVPFYSVVQVFASLFHSEPPVSPILSYAQSAFVSTPLAACSEDTFSTD